VQGQTLAMSSLIGTWKLERCEIDTSAIPQASDQEAVTLINKMVKGFSTLKITLQENHEFTLDCAIEELKIATAVWNYKEATNSVKVFNKYAQRGSEELLLEIYATQSNGKVLFTISEVPLFFWMKKI
jgi:hypothetical protein